MSRRTQVERRHRRAFAGAMVLSLGIHGAVLAFASFNVPLFPGDDDKSARPDRFLMQHPLEIVKITPPAVQKRAAKAVTGARPAVKPLESLPTVAFKPTIRRSAPQAVTLQTVRVVPTQTVSLEDVLASANQTARRSATESNLASFQPASRAARRSGRKRNRRRRGGGGGQGPILVVSGGEMGNCSTPAAAIFNVFAGRNR